MKNVAFTYMKVTTAIANFYKTREKIYSAVCKSQKSRCLSHLHEKRTKTLKRQKIDRPE